MIANRFHKTIIDIVKQQVNEILVESVQAGLIAFGDVLADNPTQVTLPIAIGPLDLLFGLVGLPILDSVGQYLSMPCIDVSYLYSTNIYHGGPDPTMAGINPYLLDPCSPADRALPKKMRSDPNCVY